MKNKNKNKNARIIRHSLENNHQEISMENVRIINKNFKITTINGKSPISYLY